MRSTSRRIFHPPLLGRAGVLLALPFSILLLPSSFIHAEEFPRFSWPDSDSFLLLDFVEPLGYSIMAPATLFSQQNASDPPGPQARAQIDMYRRAELYGSGRLVLTHPGRSVPLQTTTVQLAKAEIRSLILSIVGTPLLDLEDEALLARELSAYPPRTSPTLGDGSAITLRLRLSELELESGKPQQNVSKELRLRSPSVRAEVNPSIPELAAARDALTRLRRRLFRLP